MKIRTLGLFFCSAITAVFNSSAQDLSPFTKQFISVKADTLAFLHATVIDGTGAAAKNDQTVIVINGKIAAAGNASSITVPAAAKQIDCTGKTLIPGMIMMHEHLFYGESIPPQYHGLAMPVSFPRLYLAGGVTTMRTTGTVSPQTDINIRDEINKGNFPGPDIDVTGPYIERAGLPIPEMLFIKNPEEAAKEVEYWISMGCTSFKVYMDITKEDLVKVVKLAHKKKMKVTGHICSVTYREAADAGIDNLEHGFIPSSDFMKNKKEGVCNPALQSASIRSLDVNSPEIKELMAYLIRKNVALTSTLPVFEPVTNRDMFPGDGGEAVTPVIRETVEKRALTRLEKDSSDIALFKKEMAWEKMFVEMGGRLMAGVDPTGAGRVIPGYADRHVPELLVEAGFSFEQAIKICSLNAAEYLGKDTETGSIEPGKKADLVLINGNPLSNIKDMRNTETVFKGGVGFDSKKLFESMKGKVGLH